MDTRYALIVEDTVSSTQDAAFDALEGEPVLVVARHQIVGRGREGRRWEQPDRGLFASLALKPEWEGADWPQLALVAGIAARDVLPRVNLKWPNDLLIPGGKVGGILTEARGPSVSIGLGVNLWWAAPPTYATGLLDADPGWDSTLDLACRWADSALDRVDRGSRGWGLDEYRMACVTIGRDVRWNDGRAGRAVGVDDRGRLLVDVGGATLVLESGEVHLSA